MLKMFRKNHDSVVHGSVIYSKSHFVEVFYRNGLNEKKNVHISVVSLDSRIAIKIREIQDYLFNFETIIDQYTFEKMKSEQSLEIQFDEISYQIAELLRETVSKETFLKLEVDFDNCQLVFYGKSKLKCIVLLTINLKLTDPKEIINELSNNIKSLKEKHDFLSRDIQNLKKEIVSKDCAYRDICAMKNSLQSEFYKQLNHVYNLAVKEHRSVETKLNEEINGLINRVNKMLCFINNLDKRILFKHQIDRQLELNFQKLKIENEQTISEINSLKSEIARLNLERQTRESKFLDLEQTIRHKTNEIEELHTKNNDLEKDVKEATRIITQKSQINDELAKDLVQANQMLVNFNYHYDNISKECEELKEQLNYKDSTIEQLNAKFENLCKEFNGYKKTYSQKEITKLKSQLVKANERIDELERQNKEALMLNNVLTKKLSAVEYPENQNQNPFSLI